MTTVTKVRRRRSVWQVVARLWRENEWLYLIIGVMLGLLLDPMVRAMQGNVNALLESLVPETISILFTVVILDRLDYYREARQVKEQLMRQMHSRYNHMALQAVEELRILGYLDDGSLIERNLRGSHLQSANLYRADLRAADLTNAILKEADLVEANLEGAQINVRQFASLLTMHGAIMPDGSQYDGRYNLPGDFDYAHRRQIDIDDPQAMADWYGVSLDEYQQGQEWARDHLPGLRNGEED